MRRRMGDALSLIQGLPLTARAEHVEDRVRAGPIRPARATTAKTMRVHARRQQGFQHRPQGIRDSKARRRRVVRRPGPRSFGARFLIHPAILPVIRIGSKWRLVTQLLGLPPVELPALQKTA